MICRLGGRICHPRLRVWLYVCKRLCPKPFEATLGSLAALSLSYHLKMPRRRKRIYKLGFIGLDATCFHARALPGTRIERNAL